MDNQKKDSLNDQWVDEVLGRQNSAREITMDEAAVAAAGLTHPDDAELERIVQETLAENWGDEFGDTPDEAAGQQEYFPTQEVTPAPEQPEEEAPQEAMQTPGFLKKIYRVLSKGDGLFGIPHLLATVIWIVLILAIGTSLGRTLWLCAADVLALGKTGQEVTITVDIDDRLPDIADKLEKAGMIRYPGLFEQFAKLTGKGNHILVGAITFNEETVYDYNALINAMSYKGDSLITVEVMVPEGYSCAQIFQLLEEKGVCAAADLEQYAAEGELDEYWFLNGVPRGHKYCLEGFLFPDTYEFYMNDEPRRVLEKFLDDFDYRFTNRMLEKYSVLNKDTGLDLSIYEVIIMASIVEKEKSADLEGYSIASVFYNRMTHSSTYPTLDSDATVLYDIDYYRKGELVTDEQINASPYNTYTHAGLPPTPVGNPGLSSLDAALDPEDTDYFFFLLDREAGFHRFSKTLAQHEQLERELGYR